ncbi:hypothetical protein SAMN05421765_0831 [Kaistella antarctica]|uniref:Uncharacterized protein n=1 Tax=Kaistella antarctica TaxID=266748 RepID=A0A448NUF6_9FLAO|nr:hypothetical protein SAMN05421765_0831 [Kaistella antarctica]VEI01256.1 Uncharacterised protein [Kaistella antarctica]
MFCINLFLSLKLNHLIFKGLEAFVPFVVDYSRYTKIKTLTTKQIYFKISNWSFLNDRKPFWKAE